MKKTTLIISLGLLLASCGAQKQAQTPVAPAPQVDASTVSARQSFEAVADTYKSWKTVEMPVKLKLTQPMNFDVSARVQMVRDSYVGVSVRMLGFEVAYIIADTDSVHAYEKMHKRYVSESISNIFKSSGYTLGNLQDLLLGRMFVPGGGTASTADVAAFTMQSDKGYVAASPAAQPAGSQIGFALDSSANRLVFTYIEAAGHDVSFTYGAPSVTPAGPVTSSTQIDANVTRSVRASFDWNLNGAKWNGNVTPRKWKVPSGAKRITVTTDLLNSLIK
ncbi:MAG: DUF4292 domain-containing protein [Muribaculaceae bacterium]